MIAALVRRWPEYLIEGTLLGLFMVAACVTVVVVAHPASPVARRVARPIARRAIIGMVMGLTAVLLITSPLGRRSGAHMNPATTLAFFALGKVAPWDALLYPIAQCLGAIAGVAAARLPLDRFVTHAAVRCAVTTPPDGTLRAARRAWAAEFTIAFVLFLAVLVLSNREATAPFTPWAVGALVWAYITFEAPLSGMSMNPARTLGSALHAREWRRLWVYFSAPPLAMLAAGLVYVGGLGGGRVYCAKLDHRGDLPCPFHCEIAHRP